MSTSFHLGSAKKVTCFRPLVGDLDWLWSCQCIDLDRSITVTSPKPVVPTIPPKSIFLLIILKIWLLAYLGHDARVDWTESHSNSFVEFHAVQLKLGGLILDPCQHYGLDRRNCLLLITDSSFSLRLRRIEYSPSRDFAHPPTDERESAV